MKLDKSDVETAAKQMRALCNSAQYGKAFLAARSLRKKYPDEPSFAYYEAVSFGDDEKGRGKKELAVRHKKAAELLKPWLRRLRCVPPAFRCAFRNEYYWFSHQPHKQYLLGGECVAAGFKRSYYSQGVGAVEMARKYFEERRAALGLRWCKKAEASWHKFFELDGNWYNSYCWYAEAAGLQGNIKGMERALEKAAKISGKPAKYFEFEDRRIKVKELLDLNRKNPE